MADLKKIPVILDTDIGDDIDDIWALDMLCKSPELEPKLVLSAITDTLGRANIIAKYLTDTGNNHIPVGVGVQGAFTQRGRYFGWASDKDRTEYRGKVCNDGIAAMLEIIRSSPETITLIAIGPLTNIAELLRRDPAVAGKVRFVAMAGSIAKSHSGPVKAEYNVKMDTPASQRVFSAAWKECVITPLDTCGFVRLRGDNYQSVLRAQDPGLRSVIDAYRMWAPGQNDWDARVESSVLFDTVAVYLAYTEDLLNMETHPLIVDDKGYTKIDAKGRPVRIALSWKNKDAFEAYLAQRLVRHGLND